MKIYSKTVYSEFSATTTESTIPFDVYYVVAIINDGLDDVYVGFSSPTAAAGTVTIKAGEKLEMPLRCTYLSVRSKSGTQAMRAIGLV